MDIKITPICHELSCAPTGPNWSQLDLSQRHQLAPEEESYRAGMRDTLRHVGETLLKLWRIDSPLTAVQWTNHECELGLW